MTADEIKALRERLGLSQMAFAVKLGISVDTVRGYEQGRRSPSVMIQDRLDRVNEAIAPFGWWPAQSGERDEHGEVVE